MGGTKRFAAGRLGPIPVALSAILVIASCDLESPQAPTFETQVTIPMSEHRISIAEIIADIEGIEVDDDDIRLTVSGTGDPVSIDDELSVSVQGTHVDSELGPFELNEGLETEAVFTFDEIAPPGTVEGTYPVPPFAFALPERTTPGLDGVSQVTFASGSLVLTVVNNLAVDLGGCVPDVEVEIRDGVSGQTLATWTPPSGIPAGGSVQSVVDLAGITMSDDLRVTISGCSPGSGTPVDVRYSDTVIVRASLDGVTAESALAEIPPQAFGTSGTTPWDDDLALTDALVSAGSASVVVGNTSPLDVDMELRFPEFTRDGGPLGFVLRVPAASSLEATVDFAGASFASPTDVTEAAYMVSATTSGSGGAEVFVTSEDGLAIDVSDIALEFEWVEGTPDPMEKTFGPVTETVEWPEETNGFAPAAATVVFSVASSVGAEVAGEIVITGTDADGVETTITEPATIAAGSLAAPVTTDVVLDETNSDILDVLAVFPTRIDVSGTFELGDGATPVRLERGGSLNASYQVIVPFAFAIGAASIELDPYDVQLDADIQDLLSDDASGATLTARLTNGLPFGAAAVLVFSPELETLFTSPELELEPLAAEPAEVDAVSGKTVVATDSRNVVTLGEADLQTISRPSIYLGVRIDLSESPGVVVVSPTDELVVEAYLTLDVTVSDGVLSGSDEE